MQMYIKFDKDNNFKTAGKMFSFKQIQTPL